jgi:hypothetical protein
MIRSPAIKNDLGAIIFVVAVWGAKEAESGCVVIALICIASVIVGAWLWWRFPIFYDMAGEAGYWGGMVIFAVTWPVMLPMLTCCYLIFFLIPHGIMWICSPTYREKERRIKQQIREAIKNDSITL